MDYDTQLELENEKVKSHFIYLFVKRIVDILFGIIGFILILPITIFVKLAYILNGDFYPIFFVQKRIGLNGKIFKMLKYRSMGPNADDELITLLNNNKELAKEYAKNKKLSNDPRITKIGKFIRRYSIDEMPQAINILKGDMSLIGNRPYLPREKKDMGKYYDYIISTKPGLTGYWQVGGRSNVSFNDRLKLEKYYSLNYSFKLDVTIFLKTFSTVLFGKTSK